MNRHLIALFLIFTCLNLFSQNQGIISGKVIDNETGFGLEGATIKVENLDFYATTNSDGYFEIKEIPASSYNVTASFIGFKSLTIFNVIVKSAGNQSLQYILNPSSEILDEVIVLESPFKTSFETPLSTQTFSAVEIETYPGGNNDITKVVQSMPGISPSIGGFRNDIIIRGGAPNESVYYLDGIEIPNINHFSTQGSAGGPVGMINVSFIENVTLSASSFDARYDNALSGVLQFEQRKGSSEGWNRNIRVSASETALTFDGPISKKTTFIGSLRRSYLQFLFELIGLPIRPDYWDYQYKLNHKIDAYNSLSFVGLGSIDKFTVALPEDPTPDQQATFDQVPFINQNSNTVGVTWKRRFKDQSGYMEMSLSNNSLWNTYSEYNDNASQTDLRFQNDALESETKLRLAVNRFQKAWKWSHGFHLQRAFYENITDNRLAGFNYNTTLDFINYGIFAQGSRDFFEDRLALSFGFRMDGDTFTKGSNLFKTFSPRVSASYSLAPSWKLNGTAGVYYKIPPYTMLGFQNSAQEFINQDLDYTRSTHLVLGVEKLLSPAARVSLEGFYKYYSDYPVSLEDGVSMANKGAGFEVLGNEAIASVGDGKAYGLELLWQQKLTDRFFGIFSYTYFYSTFSGLDPEVFRPSVWDSRHLASFTTGYKLPRNWEVSARNRFAAATPYVPTDVAQTTQVYPQIILDYDRLGSDKLDPFNQLDIRIDKKWFYKKMALDFFIEVQNVLAYANPQPPSYGLNRDASGMPVNPRSLFQVPLEEGSVIPSFGIVIDF